MKSFLYFCKRQFKCPMIIFEIAFLGYFFLGMCISYPVTLDRCDILFGADSSRVFGDMTKIIYYHYRIKVHPLFLLAVQPVTLSLNGIINYPAMTVILEEAFCGAAAVSMFYAILEHKRVKKNIRAVFVVMYGFSFSNIIFSTVPETYIFAGAVLVSYWYFIMTASEADGPLSVKELFFLVFWGVMCFGITLTNYAGYAAGLVCLLLCRYEKKNWWKNFLKINAENSAVIFFLCLFQKYVWKDSPLFWDSIIKGLNGMGYEETLYMNWSFQLEKTVRWVKQVFLYPVFSPDIDLQGTDRQLIGFSGYPDIFIKIFLTAVYSMLIICMIANLLRAFRAVSVPSVFDRRCNKQIKDNIYIFGILAVFCVNLVLHYIYGSNEAFLYSAHFLYAFFITAALSVNGIENKKAQKLAAVCLLLFCITEAYSNLKNFFKTVNLTMGLTNMHSDWLHSVKGTVLCAGISAVLYFCWMYGKWILAKTGGGELERNRICKGIMIYIIITFTAALFIAFHAQS